MSKKYPENPAKLTLHFPDRKMLEMFAGQLSDGWGENYVGMRVDWTDPFGNDPFDKRSDFAIDALDGYGAEEDSEQ